MRLIIALLVLSTFSCQSQEEDKSSQAESRLYVLGILKKHPSTEFIVTSELECSMCVGEFILRTESKYKQSTAQENNKSIIGLIYMSNKTPHSGIRKLQEKTSSIVKWYYTDNLELMKSLGNITGKKAGPYYVELKGENLIVKLLSSY